MRAGRSTRDLAKGETVCLMMPNRPEYMAIWLGITSVGGVVSLINTQLRGPSLAHCIDIVAPKHVIVAAELHRAIPLRPQLFEPAENLVAWRPRIFCASIARSSDFRPRR